MENLTGKKIAVAILSLSLLTVMAGAAVAPALNVIQEYFRDANRTLVQMIISIPALFIALTSLIFPKLCSVFKFRTLVLIGLFLYVFGGCIAGMFNNIYIVLVFRAIVGIGVGIIMPLSTGLLAFYFSPNQQDKLMGYSSAMNQMGGVTATLISGILAGISWRASFLVYLMGLFSIVLCILFLPNDRIGNHEKTVDSGEKTGFFGKYFIFAASMFLLMFTFFVYPSSFAMETVKDNIIPQRYIAVIMAGMDLIAFLGGLSFVYIKRQFGNLTKFIAPILFLAGYILLFALKGWSGTIIGSVLIGFANGLGIPFIISAASRRAGKTAASTVMPMISASMYCAQFLTPIILSLPTAVFGENTINHLPYAAAGFSALIFAVVSIKLKD